MTPDHSFPSASTGAPSPVEMMFGDFKAEHASTRRVLERFPDAKHDWRPHELSRSIAELASHVAEIPNRGVSILTTEGMEAGAQKPRPPATTAAELLAIHDAAVAAQMRALEAADMVTLLGDWTIRRGEQVMIRGPRYQLLRVVMMSHNIHHRAQLGVYYRLLGVPVPGVYGPSADDMAAHQRK